MNNSALGQYYTECDISKLLVSSISNNEPKKILELGVGEGALIKAAVDRWKKAIITGVDVDDKHISSLRTEFPEINFFLINGLSSKLESKINLEIGSIDVAICNPPYLPVEKSKEIELILSTAGLGTCDKYNRITSDLVFLAQNLLLLKKGGELGIILPDGLITSHEFRFFREQLLRGNKVEAVIELPGKTFVKTEAKTHILLVKKGVTSSPLEKIKLLKSDRKGLILNEILVNQEDLIFRMDFEFNYWKINTVETGRTLSELDVKIIRGKYTKKDLTNMNVKFLHTSDLYTSDVKHLEFDNKANINGVNAKKGDIVFSRVGKKCLGHVGIIEKGTILISDCLFRIRAPEKYRQKLFNTLSSAYGQEWIKAHAHGVCAQVISKQDLMNFKI